jgi:hypothetical protein
VLDHWTLPPGLRPSFRLRFLGTKICPLGVIRATDILNFSL